jgi:hypothetical protein
MGRLMWVAPEWGSRRAVSAFRNLLLLSQIQSKIEELESIFWGNCMGAHCHHHGGISRRRMGTMLAGAGTLAVLPMAARAATVDTLCVTCIDYRFVNKDVTWLNTHLGLDFNNYDIVALAGASLAGLKTAVPQNPQAFWDQIAIAISLHKIKKVVLLDHMDCGAYKVAFGKPPADPKLPPDEEEHYHRIVLDSVAAKLRAAPYNLQAEGFLIWPQGLPKQVTPPPPKP